MDQLANSLIRSIIAYTRFLPKIEAYDNLRQEGYSTEECIELNAALEPSIQSALRWAQWTRTSELGIDAMLQSEIQRLGDTMLASLSALRRLPDWSEFPATTPPATITALLTPTLLAWLQATASGDLLEELRQI
jgi:hypothetical protein